MNFAFTSYHFIRYSNKKSITPFLISFVSVIFSINMLICYFRLGSAKPNKSYVQSSLIKRIMTLGKIQTKKFFLHFYIFEDLKLRRSLIMNERRKKIFFKTMAVGHNLIFVDDFTFTPAVIFNKNYL